MGHRLRLFPLHSLVETKQVYVGSVLTAWCSRLSFETLGRVSTSSEHNPGLSTPCCCTCIIVGPPCWSLVLALFLFPGLSQFVQLSLHGTHAETKTTLCPTGSLGPLLSPSVRCVLTVLCGPGAPQTARSFPALPHGHPARHSSLASKVHRCMRAPPS